MRTVVSGIGAFLLLIGWTPLASADEIVFVKKGRVAEKGTIIKDDVDGVSIRVSKRGMSGELQFRRQDIREVRYECLQMHYARGEQFLEQDKHDVALLSYEQAEDESSVKTNKYAMQYVLLRLAQCHRKVGKPENVKKAVQYWEKLRAIIPDGKGLFMSQAIEGLLDGYARLRDWDKALRAVSELKKLGGDYELMASVYRAEILERRGQFPQAAAAYKDLLKKRLKSEVRAKSLAGVARCSLSPARGKDWGSALKAATDILKLSGSEKAPDEALAVAYQVRGENKVRSMMDITPKDLSKSKDSQEKVMDALEDMLRPVVQYKGSGWAEPRALYYVGYWSQKMERAGLGPKWQERAREMFKAVNRSHPETKWARLAAEALTAMKSQ